MAIDVMNEPRIGDYEVHPVAAMFPLLEGEEYEKLKKSLQDHGQQQPIVLKGRVLIDGRNRLKALLELGQQPVVQEYAGSLAPEEYILTANLFRRHLTDDQRTMIATQAIHWKETKAAAARQREAGEHGSKGGRGKKTLAGNSTQGFREPTVSEKIAALAKTTDHAARQAIAVTKHAPELVEPVKQGTVPLRSAAKVAQKRKPPRQTNTQPKGSNSEDFGRALDGILAEISKHAFRFYQACSSEERKALFKRRLLQKLTELWGPAEATEAAPNWSKHER
jgi:ParB-like chromosome segregation protein Spo0J